MNSRFNRALFFRPLYCGVLLVSAQAPALAVTASQVDDFQDGTNGQWKIGRQSNSNAPQNIVLGGNPGSFLQSTSTGGGGPASRLVIFNDDQWTGNYLDAEIVGIDVDFQYLDGLAAMPMRIAIQGAGSRYGSSTAFSLPADGQWHTASFGLAPEDVSLISGQASLEQVLSAVGTVRILAAAGGPSWLGDKVAARIGLDNITAVAQLPALQAGDADQDLDFDQFDLIRVQQAAKYLTGQSATWGEGDWNGAPGGAAGAPPAGDEQFNQLDIISALNNALYLTGPYAAISAGGQTGDDQTSVIYNATTGEVSVDAPSGTNLTSVNIDSASSIFVTHGNARNLDGSFDNHSMNNLFKATFGSSFAALSFGVVAQRGLAEDFVAGDLSVVGSLEGGGGLGGVDLVYIPEPSAIWLLSLGLLALLLVRLPNHTATASNW